MGFLSYYNISGDILINIDERVADFCKQKLKHPILKVQGHLQEVSERTYELSVQIRGNLNINIEQGLDDICSRQFERPIHRIHGLLRQVNERAYEPEIVAIGPYHRAKESTKMMEEHKHRYLKNLINSKPLQEYRAAMSELENEACEYYVEPIGLNDDKGKFVDMMILDGCFIIELLRKNNMSELREKDDIIFKFDWMLSSLQRDLLLLENQMPFKVLCKLFDLVEAPNQHSRLAYLVCCFFKNLFPGMTIDEDKVDETKDDVGHLLGLIHSRWHNLGSQQNDAKVRKIQRDRKFLCASTLKEAGVVFKKGENLSLFAIEFQKGKLRIPQLTFEDRTETIFRNFLAYEQYSKKPQERFVTDYINFLGRLIGSEGDVDLLCEYSIIDNWMGDTKAISDIFRKINECITVESPESRYSMVFEKLNTHCNKRGGCGSKFGIINHQYTTVP
ncbi:PREDICTED: UPF0481 protein At3g47200-like [Ipomoea nil]|uniref:UPF0481 protein At3g47200-like n=1 Tax=Ipomoea nil TaxID=35883 RepID=UPI0009018870|nr:PREDICTED: UPF0481 protein At3g47200-like [Ipomoea nil]